MDELNFESNDPQIRTLTVMANETWLPWSRGTGKTVGVIAPWILHKVEVMPRSSGGFVAKSFIDFKSKIIEPLYEAFGMLGHEKDIHFVYGKRPPDSWAKPYIPIEDFSNVMSWPNGTVMKLISLHNVGSANSLSLQWIVGDEAKYLDEVRLTGEVFPILRGNVKYFGDSPWYGAKLFVTDKLSTNIHWILDKKKLMDKELVEAIIFYQLQANEMVMKIAEVAESEAIKLRMKLRKLLAMLAVLRKKCVFYHEAKAMDNVKNLSPAFFEQQKRSLTPWQYSISIDNEDPRRVENGFYSSREARHTYVSDFDEDITKPLAVALDYQASISPIVACQINDRVKPGIRTLNFIRAMYVKMPLGLKHVIDDFCSVYASRPCKEIFYFYDHTAVGKKNMHKTFNEEVEQYFVANGWKVTNVYMGGAPYQNIKYSRINAMLQQDEKYPIQINLVGCETMLLSMDQSETTETPGKGTGKNKLKEKDVRVPQENTTHFGDVFDQLVWGIIEMDKYPMESEIPIRLGFG